MKETEQPGAPYFENAIIRRKEALETFFRIDAFIIHGKNWVEYPPGKLDKLKRKTAAEKRQAIMEVENIVGTMLPKRPDARQFRIEVRKALKRVLNEGQKQDEKPFKLRLSKDSRISAIATGMLWEYYAKLQPDDSPLLIFSTGKTAGRDWPSEAQAMVDYMKIRFPNIPDKCIVFEDKSYDTPGNVTESKAILEGKDLSPELQKKLEGKELRNVGYLTIGYHNPRVARLMDYYDVPISVIFPTEQIIRGRSARHEAFISAYLKSDEWSRQVGREDKLNAEILVDPGQKIMSRAITKFVRHQ